jgi:UDP-N-acetylmuramate dehydrogenase
MSFEIRQDVALSGYTSWLIGGRAQFYAQPSNLDELKQSVEFAERKSMPITIFSGGSNVLISDQGIKGLVIHMSRFVGTLVEERDGRLIVTALAGTPKSELLKIFLKNQLEPALFLAGIPGDVGGGVVMNAGVSEAIRPKEFVEIVDWIRVLRGGGVKTFIREELNWKYRHCEGWQPGIIIEVGMSWPLKKDATILQKVRDANGVRLKKQPLDKPSCGSVFRNPPGDSAGRLIESLGLKGFRIGDAQVSEKHANFIVNLGQATAKDTRHVIEHVQSEVKKKSGIGLQTEVVFLGAW